MGSTKTIAEGRYLGLYERDDWEFAERTNAEGVEGMNAPVIEIPAGLIGDEDDHRGESLAETAHRELLEETGYQAESMKLLLSGPTSAGMTSETTHLFLATGLQQVSRGGGVGDENIRVHRVPLDHLRTWLSEQEAKGLLLDFKIHAVLWLAGCHDHGLQ